MKTNLNRSPNLPTGLPWTESDEFESLLLKRPLSEWERELARSFHDKGFAIIPNVFSDDLIERAKRSADLLFRPTVAEGPRSQYRVMDAWKESVDIRGIAIHEKVINALRMLYEREPIPFQTLNFLYGSQQRSHSDTIHFHCIPERFMCGVWAALEDVSEENGPLFYYPGSHRLPIYDMYDIGLNVENPDYARYENFIENLMVEKGLKREILTVKKGTILIWSANLVHGGSTILEPGMTRRSQVTHYFFEDCLYYSPIFSNRPQGEFFLNDFDVKLNIRTLQPLKPSWDGKALEFELVAKGRFRIVEKTDRLQLLRRSAKRKKARLAIPYRRIRHSVQKIIARFK